MVTEKNMFENSDPAETASQGHHHIPEERSHQRNLGLTQIQNHKHACADTSPEFVFSFQDVKQLS